MAWYKMKRFTRIVRLSKKRKNSTKGDKGLDVDDTDGSEYGHDAAAPRSQAKMSLLGSTSFCCASGQKEDYIPDAKIVPAVRPPKKRPPNIPNKKDPGPDSSTPMSPLLAAGRNFLARNKKGKVNQDIVEVSEVPVAPAETASVKLSQEDIKVRPSGIDNRLRLPDDRRKITPPSPQRRLPREPAIQRKEHPDARKYSDAIRKYRKDSATNSQFTPETTKKCKHASDSSSLQKLLDPGSTLQNGHGKSDAGKGGFSVQQNTREVQPVGLLSKDTVVGACAEMLKKSHESDDFDCPCCDRTSLMMDEAGLSDIEVKMFTSCDVIAPDAPMSRGEDNKENANDMEIALQSEVQSLKQDLQAEKLKLQTQQDIVQRLEDELSVLSFLWRNHLEPCIFSLLKSQRKLTRLCKCKSDDETRKNKR